MYACMCVGLSGKHIVDEAMRKERLSVLDFPLRKTLLGSNKQFEYDVRFAVAREQPVSMCLPACSFVCVFVCYALGLGFCVYVCVCMCLYPILVYPCVSLCINIFVPYHALPGCSCIP